MLKTADVQRYYVVTLSYSGHHSLSCGTEQNYVLYIPTMDKVERDAREQTTRPSHFASHKIGPTPIQRFH
jgi:hypothetical protein